MQTYIALLYSIGISEGQRLKMVEWRAMMEELGLNSPRTLIATGNALFEAENTRIRTLETRLENAFEQRFGRRVDTIVRSASNWRRLTLRNPFRPESEEDGSRVIARVMRAPLGAEALAPLERSLTKGEQIKLIDGDLWIHFREKPSQSRLLPMLNAKRLGVGTLRNWNTIRRIDEMLAL